MTPITCAKPSPPRERSPSSPTTLHVPSNIPSTSISMPSAISWNAASASSSSSAESQPASKRPPEITGPSSLSQPSSYGCDKCPRSLGHAHIFEAPSYRDGVEVFEAVLHGDGAWRFGRWIAVPAAEAADDPSGPGKAVGRMRGPEPFTLGLEILVEGAERCDLVGIEGKPDRLIAATIARL